MPTHREEMGARIRARREQLGLSRGGLAKLMPGKTDGNQIYRWETGKHRPSDDVLEHLAVALETDVASFYPATPEKGPTPDPFPNGSPVEQQLARIESKLDELPASSAVDELREMVRDLAVQREVAMREWRDEFDTWRDEDAQIGALEASLTEIKAMLLVPPDDREQRFAEIAEQLEAEKRPTPEQRKKRAEEAGAKMVQALRGKS